MSDAKEIEKAERMSGVRAALMAAGAAIILIDAGIQFGVRAYTGSGARGASWIVLIGLWTVILWHGGGLRLTRRMRALINDELALQNRARAVAAGFYTAIFACLALYVAQWSVAMTAGDALKLVSGCALAAALLRYAALERR
jgi:protein-S-isoprenylcysteine O-methyltransferase Ste14